MVQITSIVAKDGFHQLASSKPAEKKEDASIFASASEKPKSQSTPVVPDDDPKSKANIDSLIKGGASEDQAQAIDLISRLCGFGIYAPKQRYK